MQFQKTCWTFNEEGPIWALKKKKKRKKGLNDSWSFTEILHLSVRVKLLEEQKTLQTGYFNHFILQSVLSKKFACERGFHCVHLGGLVFGRCIIVVCIVSGLVECFHSDLWFSMLFSTTSETTAAVSTGVGETVPGKVRRWWIAAPCRYQVNFTLCFCFIHLIYTLNQQKRRELTVCSLKDFPP